MSPVEEPAETAGLDARSRRDLMAVKQYLAASMLPDPVKAATHVAAGFTVRFTGGRIYDDPRGPTSFNAQRYRRVRKRIVRYDVVAGRHETVVYSLGYLYGEWPDGTPFDHNRYVDRFTVRDALIVDTDVWNDSAEWILDPSIAR